jgi:putative transposase
MTRKNATAAPSAWQVMIIPRPGAYFVTICLRSGACLHGQVVDREMRLSEWGDVASWHWRRIPQQFPSADLDAWVVMPNHLHGIITIGGKGEASPVGDLLTQDLTKGGVALQVSGVARDASPLQRGSLGAFVGNFKSVTTRRINRMRHTPGAPFWQRNYWDHIIRDGRSLNRIRVYVENNPVRWAEDQLHPAAPPNPFNRW